MLRFLKVQAASILGSLIDYLVTIIMVEIFHAWYVMANIFGNVCGGSLQFYLCRKWAFSNAPGKVKSQLAKFILVFAGNILLSAAGIYFFTHYLRLNYLVSKTVSSILLGVSYNYVLQKKFVFAVNRG